MGQRERLIELLAKSSAPYCVFCDALGSEECKECSEYHKLVMIEKQADYLLANGVVVLPCRCGETVYNISNKICKQKTKPRNTCYDCDGTEFWNNCFVANDNPFDVEFEYDMIDEIGKTVFLTREEAEKALAKQKGGGE